MTIRVENDGEITVVTIDRPAARNAVDPDTAEALFQAFIAFEADSAAKVAVLTGAGSVFCSGFDLKHAAHGIDQRWFAEHEIDDTSDLREVQTRKGPMGPTRLSLSKPVIAAIAGPAVAGGIELALWCDMRVMEASAYMGVYCRRWGVPLIDGGTVRLPRIVGHGRAMDLILTGRQIRADECRDWGLANRTCDDGKALETAVGLARELARFPQACMRADRISAIRQWSLSVESALADEWKSAAAIGAEGASGAARFASGRGRSGDFGAI